MELPQPETGLVDEDQMSLTGVNSNDDESFEVSKGNEDQNAPIEE